MREAAVWAMVASRVREGGLLVADQDRQLDLDRGISGQGSHSHGGTGEDARLPQFLYHILGGEVGQLCVAADPAVPLRHFIRLS